MAIAIETAYNALSQNQLRTTGQYEVFCTSGYSEIDNVLQNITIYATGFEAPNRTQEFAEATFKGYPIYVPTVLKMGQEHSMTVRADNNGEIRRAFLAWQAKTADPDIEGGSVFAGDRRVNIGSSIRLHLLGNDNSSVAEVIKCVGVRIQEIGAISMSSDGSGIAEFTVTFKSQYWKNENVANGALTDQV